MPPLCRKKQVEGRYKYENKCLTSVANFLCHVFLLSFFLHFSRQHFSAAYAIASAFDIFSKVLFCMALYLDELNLAKFCHDTLRQSG